MLCEGEQINVSFHQNRPTLALNGFFRLRKTVEQHSFLIEYRVGRIEVFRHSALLAGIHCPLCHRQESATKTNNMPNDIGNRKHQSIAEFVIVLAIVSLPNEAERRRSFHISLLIGQKTDQSFRARWSKTETKTLGNLAINLSLL